MPRQGSYVDNAMNRSLGRVGMSYGTATHSSSSGMSGGGSYASAPRTYVDNSMNRSLGRVGMEHGTAVHSSSSRMSFSSTASTPGHYVDNSMNRSLGRVGMEYGTAVHSSSSRMSVGSTASAPKHYVDNAVNRSLGRVGMELGTAVHSSSSKASVSSTVSTPRHYVDNAVNRSLGRVGMEHGTAVKHSSGSIQGNAISSSKDTPRTYVDNAYNRRLGRVGKEYGNHVPSSQASTAPGLASMKQPKVYVNNAMNRKLNRVGLELGSKPVRATFRGHTEAFSPREMERGLDAYKGIACRRAKAFEKDDHETLRICDLMEGVVNRRELGKSVRSKPVPSWLKSGEVINFDSDLEIGDKLGGGGFGDVHSAIWKGEVHCCVKLLRVQKVHERKRKQFEDEVKQLSSLNHPAIVTFYGACVESPKLAIVMEFMREGSLYDALYITSTQFDDKTKIQLSKDLLSALKYVHERNTVHRDIKSSNVLICDDLQHCKLADFGLALREEAMTQSSVADHSVVGTVKYSPHEVLQGERLTIEQYKAVDVYSMALTILELMTEEEPFDGFNPNQIRRAVESEDHTGLALIEKQPLRDLLRSCLKKTANSRPTASTFMQLFNGAA